MKLCHTSITPEDSFNFKEHMEIFSVCPQLILNSKKVYL